MKFVSILITLILVIGNTAWGASSMVEKTVPLSSGYQVTTITWTTDSAGAFAADTTDTIFRGIIIQAITAPGSVVPSNGYNIIFTTLRGLDVFGGAFNNQNNTIGSLVYPVDPINGGRTAFLLNSRIIFDVTGNIIPNAKGTVEVYWIYK